MKKIKKQKNKKTPEKLKLHGASKKIPKKGIKKAKKLKSQKAKKLTKNKIDDALRVERIITRGKERGFVTYDEILREFPTIETDIMFLDDFYEKLAQLGIDVLEIQEEAPAAKGKYAYSARSDSSYDSIQMYLREIGQYPLIAGAMEKELARRIEKGDE